MDVSAKVSNSKLKTQNSKLKTQNSKLLRVVAGGTHFTVADDATPYEVGALLDFLEYLGDVLANQPYREQVDRAEEEYRQQQGGDTRRGQVGEQQAQEYLQRAEQYRDQQQDRPEEAQHRERGVAERQYPFLGPADVF